MVLAAVSLLRPGGWVGSRIGAVGAVRIIRNEFSRYMGGMSYATFMELQALAHGVAQKAREYSLPKRTGRLRGSIVADVDANTGRVVVSAGGATDESPEGAHYASYIEFGTRFIPPRLYLTRAAEEAREDARGLLGQAAREYIRSHLGA
jgi:hypothetical protein